MNFDNLVYSFVLLSDYLSELCGFTIVNPKELKGFHIGYTKSKNY
jgi:hypothetical protein